MVQPPETHPLNPVQQSPHSEWQELTSLIEGVSNLDYIIALQESRASDENFLNEFTTVLSTAYEEDPKAQKRAEADAIRKFFTEKLQTGEELSCQQMATALYELKNRGDDEGVVEVFEAGMPSGLDMSAVLKEFYAVSLNKIGRLDDSVGVLESLMTDENARVGEVAGVLGKVRKLQSQESPDKQQKIQYMRQSVAVLDEGFSSTYEFYPGINLVYNQIELAKMTGDATLIEKAFNDAELVMYAAKKAGAERTSDYWTAATLLESSVFADKVTPQMVQSCLETSRNEWELNATVGNLKSVADTIKAEIASGDHNQSLSERLLKVLKVIDGSEGKPGIIAILEGKASVESKSIRTANDEIVDSGFMYGETTTMIGGNIEFGGQLQSHTVNRFDVKVAHSVMEHFGIDSINTVEEFNLVADGIIRKQFGTADLEDLHGAAHEVYDSQMKGLLSALGINEQVNKKVVDSRTNVMVDFLLGKGDCRQHAHAKQLLFDSWKTLKLNNLISVLQEVQQTPAAVGDEGARLKIQELLNKQMMVFDSIVESKIQMTSLYNPKHDVNGSLIESDDFEPIEDHTWNGIVTFTETGHVASLEMADSFYQDEYSFGGRKQVIAEPSSYKEEGGMVVTEIVAVDKDGIANKVPVRLKPAPYAGSRGKRMLTHADVGGAHLRGVDIGYDVPQIAHVFSSLKVKELWQEMARRD